MADEQNNGHKTPEEIKAEKLEVKKKAFEENPDKFIHSDNVICATYMSSEGHVCPMVNPSFEYGDYLMSIGIIHHELDKMLTSIDIQQYQKKNKIIQPGVKNRFGGAFGKQR